MKHRKIITGDKFAMLTIIKDVGTRVTNKSGKTRRFYLCQCDCGNKIEVRRDYLTSGEIKSCGCIRRKIVIGEKYAMLTVVQELGLRDSVSGKFQRKFYLCRCDCGGTIEVAGIDIGRSVENCGCVKKEPNKKLIAPGTIFDRLTVLELDEEASKTRQHGSYYLCKCVCGDTVVVRGDSLIGGKTLSCGCLNAEKGVEKIMLLREGAFVEGTCIPMLISPKPRSNNTSGVRGVCWNKNLAKWSAYITFKRKCYFLGCYTNISEAARVRKDAEDRIYGGFLEWYAQKKAGEAKV
jgi:hypothetical protein